MVFSGISGTSIASGSGLTGLYVSGIKMTSHGRSYDSIAPVSLFSGGTGSIGNPLAASGIVVMASGASGTAILSSGAKIKGCFGNYTKPFTGQWNFFTGTGLTGLWFREETFYNTEKTIYQNKQVSGSAGLQNFDINAIYQSYYDNELCVAKIKVSGSGNLTEERLLTGIK